VAERGSVGIPGSRVYGFLEVTNRRDTLGTTECILHAVEELQSLCC
jgi:hypothetical protein